MLVKGVPGDAGLHALSFIYCSAPWHYFSEYYYDRRSNFQSINDMLTRRRHCLGLAICQCVTFPGIEGAVTEVHCYRCASQISERFEKSKPEFRSFACGKSSVRLVNRGPDLVCP